MAILQLVIKYFIGFAFFFSFHLIGRKSIFFKVWKGVQNEYIRDSHNCIYKCRREQGCATKPRQHIRPCLPKIHHRVTRRTFYSPNQWKLPQKSSCSHWKLPKNPTLQSPNHLRYWELSQAFLGSLEMESHAACLRPRRSPKGIFYIMW